MRNDYIKAVRQSKRKAALNDFFSGFNSAVDESVLPLSTAYRVYNFDVSSGALEHGWGVEECDIRARNVTNVWQFRRYFEPYDAYTHTLMYSGSDGTVYFRMAGQFYPLSGVKFTSVPFAVNYRLYGEDVILMCSETDGMFVWNGAGAVYNAAGAPRITSLAMHYERMFVTVGGESSSVWFSDDLDPTNWSAELDAGGFIQMLDERGCLNKVLSFLNYVYIFRDYGISRLTAFADQSEFSAANLFVSSGRIYPKTVAACGDTVLFLAGGGLYRFDGLSTSRLAPQLKGIIRDSVNSCAAYFDGKYFAALRLEPEEGSTESAENNGLLIYDIKTNRFCVTRGVNIVNFASIDDKLYAVTKEGRVGFVTKSGAVFDKSLTKVWSGPMTDLGTDAVKTVREFYADASAPFTLTVRTERAVKEFEIKPKDGITKLKLNVRGSKVAFGIKTDSKEVKISRPGIKYTT